MKKTLKIMRSIITSLLFILLMFFIIIELVFLSVRTTGKNIPDLIDTTRLLENLYEVRIDDEKIKELSNNYLKDYINYIFYKRSYPSIQTIDFSVIDLNEQEYSKKVINTLKERADLDYETIVCLRNINNFLSNNSLFFLVDVGIFLLYIVVSLVNLNFKKGIKIFSISLISTGIIVLIGTFVISENLSNMLKPDLFNYIKEIFQNGLIDNLYKNTIIHIIIGSIILCSIIGFEKLMSIKKKR